MSAMDSLGCQHYKRKVKFVTPCCNKEYVCRFCHDEKEDHVLDRKAVRRLICLVCDKRQGFRSVCVRCGSRFGLYHCPVCRLFDDEDKQQFHCDDCGICRVGGRRNFFHCHTCNICLNAKLFGHHKCVEDASRNNCSVCLEDLHSSRSPITVPLCGHLIHETCYEALLKVPISKCPICQQAW